MDDESTVGKRIARTRKHRSLTQQGLADRTAYSRSQIAKVEAGHSLPSPAFVATIARALAVDPAEIYGQPIGEDAVPAIADLRRLLTLADVPPDLDGPPLPMDQVAADLVQLRPLQAAARHARIAARLPGLLESALAHAAEDRADAWPLVFAAAEAAADLCRKLGHHDLATTALERAAAAAHRAGDAHLAVLVMIRRSLLLLAVDQAAASSRLLSRARAAIEPGRPDTDELAGTAHLRAAIVAARAGDEAAAWSHHRQAVEIRERAGTATGTIHGVTTGFTAANVAIHGPAVAIELGDADAARRAEPPAPLLRALAPERRAHHHIDMARAYVVTGAHDEAMRRMLAADRAAPQMTRHHPMARTLVHHLVDHHRRLPESLRVLHSRMA